MTTPGDKPFVYFEAKPKRGNGEAVAKIIGEIAEIYAELYDRQATACSIPNYCLVGNGQYSLPLRSNRIKRS